MPPPISLGTLQIANTATESAILDFTTGEHAWVKDMIVVAPDTLPETVTIHVAKDSTGNFNALQSGGTDITLPVAKATHVGPVAYRFLKLVAGVAVAADRDFDLMGREER